MKTTYNKSEIMKRAWKLFRSQDERTMEMFADCLRESWRIAKTKPIYTYEEIHAKHYEDVLRYLTSKVSSRETAEDLTQDVFLKIAEKFRFYDPQRANVKTWVFTYANNRLRDHYRTDKAKYNTLVDGYVGEDGEETFEHVSTYADHGIEETEKAEMIEKATQALTVKEQAIHRLMSMQYKYKEIAEELDIPLGTVRGLINRIRTKLQTQLMPLYPEYNVQ